MGAGAEMGMALFLGGNAILLRRVASHSATPGAHKMAILAPFLDKIASLFAMSASGIGVGGAGFFSNFFALFFSYPPRIRTKIVIQVHV